MSFMAMNLLRQFFCCKMSFLIKGNVVLDIMVMSKAFYKAMYGDTGRSTEGR